MTRRWPRSTHKLADNGGAEWIGDWTPNVGRYVGKRADMILKTGVLPYFVIYNVPKRDCGQYSAGGSQGGRQVQEVDHRLRDQPRQPPRRGHPRARLAGPAGQEDG